MSIETVIQFAYFAHGVSKKTTRETVRGKWYSKFEAFLDGSWRPVWASLEHGVIVGGRGRLSSPVCRALQELAAEECVAK